MKQIKVPYLFCDCLGHHIVGNTTRRNINVTWYLFNKLFAFWNLWRQWKIEPGWGLAKVDRLTKWATKAEISCIIILFYTYCIYWTCT